jgi:uncharacterized FlaG/YvyC family protein
MDVSSVTRSTESPDVGTPVAPVEHASQTRDVIQAVKALNQTEMLGEENELVFQMDRQAGRMVIPIVNRDTKEVVSQIPPEYVLQLSENLNQSEG